MKLTQIQEEKERFRCTLWAIIGAILFLAFCIAVSYNNNKSTTPAVQSRVIYDTIVLSWDNPETKLHAYGADPFVAGAVIHNPYDVYIKYNGRKWTVDEYWAKYWYNRDYIPVIIEITDSYSSYIVKVIPRKEN